jgi:hypothetical protein
MRFLQGQHCCGYGIQSILHQRAARCKGHGQGGVCMSNPVVGVRCDILIPMDKAVPFLKKLVYCCHGWWGTTEEDIPILSLDTEIEFNIFPFSFYHIRDKPYLYMYRMEEVERSPIPDLFVELAPYIERGVVDLLYLDHWRFERYIFENGEVYFVNTVLTEHGVRGKITRSMWQH